MREMADLEARYRARSLWLDSLPESLAPRAPLPGHRDADVCIVGAGFTGLWTAYSLVSADPTLRVIVIEAEIAGYGPSGRNGGFVSGGIAGDSTVYARRGGTAGVTRAERAMVEAIDAIGEVVRSEGIDCSWVKGGSYRLATNGAQLGRIDAGLAERRRRGLGPDDVWRVTPAEIQHELRISHVLGGTFTPHCARVQPAGLVRGLAAACERRGVTIHERSRATSIAAGLVVTDHGSVRAPVVIRATESYTTRLPGERRRYLPVFSHMLATEPLPPEVWDAIGWAGRATIADQRYHFFYAQRTPRRPDRHRWPRRTLRVREQDLRARRAARGRPRPARGRVAPPFPPGRLRQGDPLLGRSLRGAARLEHARGVRPRDRARERRRDVGTRRRRVVHLGSNAGRPDPRRRQRPDDPSLGRSREPAVGARADPCHRGSLDIGWVERADLVEERTGRTARRVALVRRWMPGR